MVPLASFDQVRRNNFTVIRLVLAWLVLYGHSFAIHKTTGISDPLNALWQGSTWTGELAVLGFFCISGFLVCKSLANRSLVDYLRARALRIIPGLMVCTIATAVIMGPLLSTLSVADYFSHPDTLRYLGNGFGFFPIQWQLPGLFSGQHSSTVNGSLWTLPVEWFCYLSLAIGGFWALRLPPLLRNIYWGLAAIAIGWLLAIPGAALGIDAEWRWPCLFFLMGSAAYLNRQWIPLSPSLALLAMAITATSFGHASNQYILPISLPYLVFYCAYALPTSDRIANISDASFGIYIYAWPIQQAVEYFLSPSPWLGTAIATPVVLVLALLSWHIVEQPVLTKYKSRRVIDQASAMDGAVTSEGDAEPKL